MALAQVVTWARSMDRIARMVKAVDQIKDLGTDKEAFARFVETGALPSKKLRWGF